MHAAHGGQATTRGGGTEGWQSPETIVGEGATTASDVFSLGLIFFFVLTGGGHPFGEDARKRCRTMTRFAVTDPDDEEEVEEADAKVRKGMASALQSMPAAVPPDALETIASMLRFAPASRPSAEDVLKSALLDGGASAAKVDVAPPPPAPPSECAVCWDAPAEFAVVPCGHLCLCAGCLGTASALCPICRSPSTGTYQIYTT